MTYFIYSGSINCDNYKSESPKHTIDVVETEEEVIAAYKEFKENTRDDDVAVEFRVFKGEELKLTPIQVETDFKLSK